MARAVALLAMLVLVATTSGAAAQAQKCDASALAVCVPAIIGGSPPTSPCCSALRAQEGCLCQFARDPAYRRYIDSPNARRTLTTCGIAIPHCG